MARQPHVLVVSSPVQGHVTPLLKLSHQIANQGIKVTFVNTEITHEKIVAAMSDEGKQQLGIKLASVPDGIEHEVDRKDIFKYSETIQRCMPGHLKDLIEKMNHSRNEGPITCILADATMGCILEAVQDLDIEKAAVWTGSAAGLAFFCQIPKLIQEGLLDSNGNIRESDEITISKEIPPWKSSELPWNFPGDPKAQKLFFDMSLTIGPTVQSVSWTLCNTFYELHSSACILVPNMLPVGPCLASTKNSAHSGSFLLEDTSCLSWLGKQEPSSVVYVAFGSIAVLSQEQFGELALGLEQSGQPFLWVVRPEFANGSTAVYPAGFLERVANRGKIVEWAPQEKVLSHPAIAGFLSHCGWNSTIEAISFGIPFLCWPYFTDQFHNQKYICDIWKVGLRLNPKENDGIRSRNEISTKIRQLLCNDQMRMNALKLKDLGHRSISKGGSSSQNLAKFLTHLKH